jgi:SAM-dependent methyltransferase
MSFLSEPSVRGVEVGSPLFFSLRSKLIRGRPLLNYCYDIWYRLLLDDPSVRDSGPDAVLLELGSGGSLLKDFEPRVITSDVTAGIAEKVIDARSLPFGDGSVSAIFMTHVFHHIPDVRKFLSEATRVLKPGGTVAMIDVAATPFARVFFRNLHPEPFLPKEKDWVFKQGDSMLDSNQALSWIVFQRDRRLFEAEFPQLKIEVVQYLPWLPYLLSGGVTRRDVIPRFATRPIIALDKLTAGLRPLFALHWFIRLRRV